MYQRIRLRNKNFFLQAPITIIHSQKLKTKAMSYYCLLPELPLELSHKLWQTDYETLYTQAQQVPIYKRTAYKETYAYPSTKIIF
jgi:hypothetical protein